MPNKSEVFQALLQAGRVREALGQLADVGAATEIIAGASQEVRGLVDQTFRNCLEKDKGLALDMLANPVTGAFISKEMASQTALKIRELLREAATEGRIPTVLQAIRHQSICEGAFCDAQTVQGVIFQEITPSIAEELSRNQYFRAHLEKWFPMERSCPTLRPASNAEPNPQTNFAAVPVTPFLRFHGTIEEPTTIYSDETGTIAATLYTNAATQIKIFNPERFFTGRFRDSLVLQLAESDDNLKGNSYNQGTCQAYEIVVGEHTYKLYRPLGQAALVRIRSDFTPEGFSRVIRDRELEDRKEYEVGAGGSVHSNIKHLDWKRAFREIRIFDQRMKKNDRVFNPEVYKKCIEGFLKHMEQVVPGSTVGLTQSIFYNERGEEPFLCVSLDQISRRMVELGPKTEETLPESRAPVAVPPPTPVPPARVTPPPPAAPPASRALAVALPPPPAPPTMAPAPVTVVANAQTLVQPPPRIQLPPIEDGQIRSLKGTSSSDRVKECMFSYYLGQNYKHLVNPERIDDPRTTALINLLQDNNLLPRDTNKVKEDLRREIRPGKDLFYALSHLTLQHIKALTMAPAR